LTDTQWLLSGGRIVVYLPPYVDKFALFPSEDKNLPCFRKVWFPSWSILMMFDLGDKAVGDEWIQDGRLYVTFQL
jgi:hypothetical protein